MGLRFFHRFPIIGRFLTVNVSKTGASVSVGVPGLHVTSGTHGSRVTVGIPGTGLFYTQMLDVAARQPAVPAAQTFLREMQACAANPQATPTDYARALNRMTALGLRDDDLPAALLEAVQQLRTTLRDEHGFRLQRTVTTPPPPVLPSSSAATVVKVGILLLTIAVLAVLVVAWMAG
jgi:hypothetical protein